MSERVVNLVAVGSTNPVKVRAVAGVIHEIWPEAEVRGVAVESGVGEMPMSDEAGAEGARQRAAAAQLALDADLGLGLEGAGHVDGETVYICNWAAVVGRDGVDSVAMGGRLPLPRCIGDRLLAGEELGPLIDQHTGGHNTKQHQGAAGFLTLGLVSREQAFRVAVAFALTPLLSPALYAQRS